MLILIQMKYDGQYAQPIREYCFEDYNLHRMVKLTSEPGGNSLVLSVEHAEWREQV